MADTDELRELLAKATPVEIKDEAGWSLSLCFGHGDKGRDAMRQFCDTLIAQTKADAARIAALEAEVERLKQMVEEAFLGEWDDDPDD